MNSGVTALIGALGLATTVACARSAAVETGRPPIAVEVALAQSADVVESVDVVGSLAPKLAADVKSEYSGIVAVVHVTEWVGVRKGQPLATLDTRESEAAVAAARAALLQAEVAGARARREGERAEKLQQVGLMTRQGVEDARTAREAAVAAVAAARAQLEGAETRRAKAVIRAPFDGTVASRAVEVGDRVESMGSGDPLFRVVDDRLLELTMTVPSSRLAAVRLDQPVQFTVDARAGSTFEGRVMYINPSVDPVSRAGKVIAHVGNAGHRLKGGLFVKARIQTGTRRAVVQVPRAALQEWDLATGAAAVFVIRGDTAQHRAIRAGVTMGETVEVAEGLEAGERVATRGAFNLRHGDRVKTAAGTGA
jgi:RND family efflux transporter MFP subunit